MKYRGIVGMGLFFILAFSLLVSIYSPTIQDQETPVAKQGVLDLSKWDFEKQGLVDLDGEWEFYENELLSPTEIRQRIDKKSTYLTVPGTWKGKIIEDGMHRKGAGTYRLKVLVKDSDEILGLKIRSIRMSQKLFINGKQEGESGVPSTDRESFKPGNTPYTVFFQSNTQEIEIIIQVSNFNFITGGIVNSIPLGVQADITKVNSIQIGTDIGIILILGMFGAYHLSFYFVGRREKAYLLSGLYLLVLSLNNSLYGEKLFQQLLPYVPFESTYKMLEISQFIGSIIIIMFYCSVESRLMSSKRMRIVLSPFVFYLFSVLVLPYGVHIRMKYVFVTYLGIVMLAIIVRMIYLYVRSQSQTTDRKELFLFISGAISLLIFFFDVSLYSENVLQTDLVGKCGVIGFIVFFNIMLAVRFSNTYDKTETLSRQLLISNQLKDEFLMNTSHEIKTPLHGIMNMTSFLLEDGEDNLYPIQKQNLWLIKDTSTKLSMLIQDLIDVSLLKHGELRLQQTVVDLRVASQIVFDVLQFELAGKSVRLDNQVEPDVWVLADDSRLRQVMYNLVHNAIKHTDKGFIQIKAYVEGNTVSVTVEDTGTGISPDMHTAIFEYFEQVDKPLPQDGYTGMGVGLYISRKLIERMGGEIRVDWSEIGQGTRMIFTLPKIERIPGYREVAATGVGQHAQFEHTSLDIVDQSGYTILIVDDEASNIHILLNILRRHHYNVITAFSANEAMDKMEQYPNVDLVILDVMMPGISGIELCRTLRVRYSILDLPILFATVKDAPTDIALGFRAGANDYITKPFDGETLIARIQTLIAMKTSIQEAIRNEYAFHQAQIKPHFLYNALSSVISFCYTDGEKAAYLLSMLSQYIRYILDMDRSTLVVPLHRELELIQAYVEIEKARFGERFDFIFNMDEGLRSVEIPSLCIQPFVENAIRHGLFEKEGQGRVSLTIQAGGNYMKVIIEDDGVGMPDDLLYQLTGDEQLDGSIGIHNIRKRIGAIPGATLTIHSDLGFGTKVTMYLPASLGGMEGETR
ncbi:ATP-binding protein [Paenibacillus sp. G2S3]|uniref:hybrid sensor histidine kinase/response regulator n=1 Tax=Paenibacillus sp. G2S3 TaxID=3047872 RepID=UPI0024C13902|nr:ATP-binding protein [Paenibacillus sp. G2S3]WHY22257.1 ATP-binding protein [Paenibacillus sp. G2S3]